MKHSIILAAAVSLGTIASMGASAQTSVISPITVPKTSTSTTITPAVNLVRTARVDRIFGVNTSDKNCQTYRPAGVENPVIYRRDAGDASQIEIFAADTGLVLVGDNLDLVNSLVMKYDNGRVLKGDIVSRRAGKSACNEDTSETVIVARFKLPGETSIQRASLEVYAQEGRTSSISVTTDDLSTNPATLTEAHNTKIRPKPTFGPVALPNRTIPAGERSLFEVSARNDASFSFVIVTDRTLRLSPASAYATRSGTQNGKMTVTVEAGTTPGTYNAALMPGIALTRQPEGNTPGSPQLSKLRFVNDTAWAGSDATGYNFARKFGNTDVVITIIPKVSTDVTKDDPVQPEPIENTSSIEAFDPGNRLFQVNGNTTDGDNHLSSLDSKEWCADLFKSAPDPKVSASFVYGETTLPPIRWGVKNADRSSFTGIIKADLTKDSRVKDTLNFSGTLAAGQTRIESFNRQTAPVPIAWDTVGQLCYYVGTEQDPVVENGRWVIQINEPGNDNERIFSIQ